MIASLEGQLTAKNKTSVVINVNGVGYEVFINPKGMDNLPESGNNVFLHIYTHITEITMQLFGFLQKREKELFIRLININGIGPKVAQQMLSGLAYHDLIQAITTEDIARLTMINGIGKKTAERICVELKDKLIDLVDSTFIATARDTIRLTDQDGPFNEAMTALMHLGYSRQEARQALNNCGTGATRSVEILIRESLSYLGRA